MLQTAANDAPRFDHNPTTGESLGLLVEEQRTNLVLQASAISGSAPWETQGTAPTITANAFASPDGNTTATRVTFITGDSRITQRTIPVTNGTTYTFSLYARPVTVGTLNKIRLACFDTVSQNNSNDITLVAGWQRISFTFTSTGTGNATINIRNEVSGLIANDVYIWGAQLEAGAFPTSYIPTTTTALTRSADVASITGSNFSSWYRQDEGTVFADALGVNNVSGATRRYTEIRDNPSADRYVLGYSQTNTVTVADITVSSLPTAKAAGSYKLNSFQLASNGVLGTEDGVGAVPTPDQMFIGSQDGATANTFINGTIRRLTYWPVRLGNNVLQQITQ
jgi:hypothetical protein